MTNQPGGRLKPAAALSDSNLNPLGTMGARLAKKALLVPVAVVMLIMVALFQVTIRMDRESAQFAAAVVGLAFATASVWLVYHMCGKRVPWWWLLAVALAPTVLFPVFPYFNSVFRGVLPESVSGGSGFLLKYVNQFIGTGLCEECFKAVPVLVGVWIGRRAASPWRERLGVREPLDGILLGVASGAGFTVLETLGVYGPAMFAKVVERLGGELGDKVGALAEVVLVIPRMLQAVAGHCAWAGYLGYFIGLAVMKPRHAGKAILFGLIPAAGAHALWNTSADYSASAMFAVAMLSYAGLAAAILQARKISPTRADNFASTFSETAPVVAMPSGGLSLRVGGEVYALRYGVRFREAQIPGALSALGDGIVGEVSHNPKDPKILGIKNLSAAGWRYRNPAGKEMDLPAGKSAKLVRGALIHFGKSDGAIE